MDDQQAVEAIYNLSQGMRQIADALEQLAQVIEKELADARSSE